MFAYTNVSLLVNWSALSRIDLHPSRTIICHWTKCFDSRAFASYRTTKSQITQLVNVDQILLELMCTSSHYWNDMLLYTKVVSMLETSDGGKATSDCKPVIALEDYMKTGQSKDLWKQRLFGILYTETRKQMRKQWIIELANVVSSNFYPNILCRRSIRGLFNKEIHVVPIPCFSDLCPRLMLQDHDARAAFS